MSKHFKYNVHPLISKHITPNSWRSIMEIALTMILLLLCLVNFYFAMQFAIWSSLVLLLPISLFFTRIFILQHDLSHGNLFYSRKHNDIIGIFLSIIVFTPYYLWRKAHILHHESGGNADKRPWIGDIEVLTVREYRAKSRLGRFLYRLYRNSFVMFILGGIYQFLIDQRFYKKIHRSNKAFGMKEFWSVIGTNIAIIILYGTLIAWLGIKFFLFAIIIPMWLAGIIGIHLFYVQHNFRNKYFVSKKEWDFQDSALKGSSFYDLPQPLRWLTANIGYHHVHTLVPRLPFYSLQKCHQENNFFHLAPRFYLKDVPKLISLKLYDEESREMITWKEYNSKTSALRQKG